ncbi:MAG: hypothetical protein PGN34_07290 [Methylobacterium frigidaeris]
MPSTSSRGLAAALLAPLLVAAVPACGQEAEAPLTIRIRPLGTEEFDGALPDRDEAVARSLAARAAFEARATARANRAIASVCTGCLAPGPLIDQFFARAP